MENHCFTLLYYLQKEKIKDKFEAYDKEKIKDAVQLYFGWARQHFRA